MVRIKIQLVVVMLFKVHQLMHLFEIWEKYGFMKLFVKADRCTSLCSELLKNENGEKINKNLAAIYTSV